MSTTKGLESLKGEMAFRKIPKFVHPFFIFRHLENIDGQSN